jgi:hypothetical protein
MMIRNILEKTAKGNSKQLFDPRHQSQRAAFILPETSSNSSWVIVTFQCSKLTVFI